MKIVLSRKHYAWLAGIGAGIAVLAWPVGTWLQGRDMMLAEHKAPDAIYLVAGAKHQNRRIEAIRTWFEVQGPGAGGVRTIVLVGNDEEKSYWSGLDQRNLTAVEWAIRKLEAFMTGAGQNGSIEVVPGKFHGTDGEMEALADFLKTRAEIRSLAMATSPFHARRAAGRLKTHLAAELDISVLPVREEWGDRAPWTVLFELGKMCRDRLGLSRAPLLSRRR